MSFLKIFLFILFLVSSSAGNVFAAGPEKPSALPVPDAIKKVKDKDIEKRSQCFLQEELDQYDVWLDSKRIDVSGCTKGVVLPEKKLRPTALTKKARTGL